MDKLSGVEDTLFIPLLGRSYTTKRFPMFFQDKQAVELCKDVDRKEIESNNDEYSYVTSATRYFNLDKITKNFIKNNTKVNIVNLGAGLDTQYSRLGNPNVNYYILDLPNVIELRKKYLQPSENETLISSDLFDTTWFEKIDRNLPTLFISSGVFMYFKKEKIVDFIKTLKSNFKNSELVFDVLNSKGLKFANKYVQKSGNDSALMYFYIDSVESFHKDLGDIKSIQSIKYFEETRAILKRKLKFKSRFYMKVCDSQSNLKIIHIKF